MRSSGSFGCRGCSIHWGDGYSRHKGQPTFGYGQDSIILEGGPENRWPPSALPHCCSVPLALKESGENITYRKIWEVCNGL